MTLFLSAGMRCACVCVRACVRACACVSRTHLLQEVHLISFIFLNYCSLLTVMSYISFLGHTILYTKGISTTVQIFSRGKKINDKKSNRSLDFNMFVRVAETEIFLKVESSEFIIHL